MEPENNLGDSLQEDNRGYSLQFGGGGRELNQYNARYQRMERGGGRLGGDNDDANPLQEFLQNRMTKSAWSYIIGFSVLLVSVLFSVGSLMPTEYGVKYNVITKSMDTHNVYHGGRHLIWPWNQFVIFPATAPTIEFSENPGANQGPLTTRTKDGLGLSLSVSFQYRLIKEDVTKLYALANYNYEPLFIRNARDVLLKAAADYDAPEYWEKRRVIGEEMRQFLEVRLKESFAECVGLQILVVHLPQSYEKSIVETQVQKQRVETRHKEQESARIEAQTKVIESEYNRNVTVTLAAGTASYFQKTQLAQAGALQERIAVESEALADASRSLGIENSTDLVAYMKYLVLAQSTTQTPPPPSPPPPPTAAVSLPWSTTSEAAAMSVNSGGDPTPVNSNSIYIYNLENARVNVR